MKSFVNFSFFWDIPSVRFTEFNEKRNILLYLLGERRAEEVINTSSAGLVQFGGAKEEENKSNFYDNRVKAIFHFFEVQYAISSFLEKTRYSLKC